VLTVKLTGVIQLPERLNAITNPDVLTSTLHIVSIDECE